MSFSKKKLYLAGPITGLTYNGARNGWRREFANLLAARGDHLECYSPMREKDFLEKTTRIGSEADYESLEHFGTPQGILTRDYNDVFTCDAMVACFLGAEKVSIGTCVEFGFAKAHSKPIIMVMEKPTDKVSERKNIEVKVDQFTIDRGPKFARDSIIKQIGHDDFTIVTTSQDWMSSATCFLISVPAGYETIRNPHDHVFLKGCAGYCVPDLESAADIAYSLLTPGL